MMLSDLKNIVKRYLKKPLPQAFPDTKPKPVSKEARPSVPPASAKNGPLSEPYKPDRSTAGKRFHETDKHGFRKIRGHEDLDRLLNAPPPGPEAMEGRSTKVVPERGGFRIEKEKSRKERTGKALPRKKPVRMDKNGLPMLSGDLNLLRAFSPVTADEAPGPSPQPSKSRKPADADEPFEEMLSQSLSGKNVTRLLQEKDSLYQHGNPILISEKIRRYPAPESELDLHGWRAPQAVEKTDRFIRNGVRTGKLTLRIIVGKGLHSEEGAVLPDVVEEKIVALKHENIVLSYRWENRIKSRSGAIIVYLA
jgi:DNA-nicking Smr family endonuclease